jgi:hypothetical protein
MSDTTSTPATWAGVDKRLLPAYIGLALLSLIVAMLVVVVLTEAGAAAPRAERVGAGVAVLCGVLPVGVFALIQFVEGRR